MIRPHPALNGNVDANLLRCIEACLDCAQTCICCAEACRHCEDACASAADSIKPSLQ